MNDRRFVHDDGEFEQLIRIVADRVGLTEGIVEKDYWVTHSLWSLQRTGIRICFKGGTSLSKSFGLIQRFSEDVDVTLERGMRTDLPSLGSLRSASKRATAKRKAFYEALYEIFEIPGTDIRLSPPSDGRWIVVEYLADYPKRFGLPHGMRPFVRLEAGLRNWQPPTVLRDLTSLVHDHVLELGLLEEYVDNRPRGIPCVHPFVTVVDKLDSIVKRYLREDFTPEEFVRHYEDIAHVIKAEGSLPALTEGQRQEVVDECLKGREVVSESAALTLEDGQRREKLERAHAAIAPMFWGGRIALEECCAAIREWLAATPLTDSGRQQR